MTKPIEGVFPNVGVLGYYRPYSQTIHIACTDQAAAAAISSGPPVAAHEFLTTVDHELTHWMDHTSTLCGQEYLIAIYNAAHALSRQTAGAETEYWRGMALRDFERRHNRSEYYTLLGPADAGYVAGLPWAFETRCGIEFDYAGAPNPDHPIIMVAFLDPISRALIARQPITVAALWETIAVWSEIATEREILTTLERDEARVTERLWGREHLRRAYAKGLLIYSAPTHLLSIRIGTQDIAVSYDFAAAAAHYCLNLPKAQFDSIRDPEAFSAFGDRRLNGFKAHADRGYLFTVLAGNGPLYEQGMTAQQWVNAAARASGLPDIADLSGLAADAMNELGTTLLDVDDKRYVESILEIGRHNFLRRLAESDPAVTPSRLALGVFQVPPSIFDAGGIYQSCRPPRLIPISEQTLENMVGFGHFVDKLLKNFQGACR